MTAPAAAPIPPFGGIADLGLAGIGIRGLAAGGEQRERDAGTNGVEPHESVHAVSPVTIGWCPQVPSARLASRSIF
jgi:hypothetical protein